MLSVFYIVTSSDNASSRQALHRVVVCILRVVMPVNDAHLEHFVADFRFFGTMSTLAMGQPIGQLWPYKILDAQFDVSFAMSGK